MDILRFYQGILFFLLIHILHNQSINNDKIFYFLFFFIYFFYFFYFFFLLYMLRAKRVGYYGHHIWLI